MVTVIDKRSGQKRRMAPKYAAILTKLGRATYARRDLQAEAAPEAAATKARKPAKKAAAKATQRAYKRRDLQAEE